jgi:4-diphosphocytidyl-2-C-methyl-D-erythritol kinase
MTGKITDTFPGVAAQSVWQEKANAKINLGLKVLGRRVDGYHEIRSIMQTVDLADTLYFYPAKQTALSCTDITLSVASDNLVQRAVERFSGQLDGRAPTFHIHLEKIIPYGAGLGGGSADAAATLRALNHLSGTPFSLVQLGEMAATLGSDIPFLINGGTALVKGRGEILEPLVWQGEVYYVLVYPEVAVSTAWAYANLALNLTAPSAYLKLFSSLGGGCIVSANLFHLLENDFQALVERTNPIVAVVRGQLKKEGAYASSMSGSGSTIYGTFDDRLAALNAQRALQAQGFRSFFCLPALPVGCHE